MVSVNIKIATKSVRILERSSSVKLQLNQIQVIYDLKYLYGILQKYIWLLVLQGVMQTTYIDKFLCLP